MADCEANDDCRERGVRPVPAELHLWLGDAGQARCVYAARIAGELGGGDGRSLVESGTAGFRSGLFQKQSNRICGNDHWSITAKWLGLCRNLDASAQTPP